MTAKVTLSFSDDTIADARRWAERDGVSLSAWIDQAARERTLRQIFTAHAAAIRRAGLDDEEAALADEREIAMVDDEVYGSRRAVASCLRWSLRAPMHHKRKRPKHLRAGCLLCKPSKLNAHKTADRMRARRAWRRDWDENTS